jgi:hypothetical protein
MTGGVRLVWTIFKGEQGVEVFCMELRGDHFP